MDGMGLSACEGFYSLSYHSLPQQAIGCQGFLPSKSRGEEGLVGVGGVLVVRYTGRIGRDDNLW